MSSSPIDLPQTDRFSGHALLVVLACGVGNVVGATTVINATFSNFLLPVSESLGWRRSDFSFVLTLLSLIGVLAYPLSGRLIDRHGARPVALAGNLLFGLSVASLALIQPSRPLVYLLFVVLGAVATLPSTVLLARVVSTWFFARRGLALGLSGGVAFGIGGAIMPIVAQYLIDHVGWRGAYAGLGALVVALGLPVFWFLLKEAPAGIPRPAARDDGPGLTRGEAFRTRAFWILFGAVSIGAGTIAAILTHLIPIVGEVGGTVPVALAAMAGLYLVNAVWQIGLGAVLDRVATPRVAGLFILPGVGGVLLLATTRSPDMMIAGGLLVGLSCGTEYGLLPFCIPRYFGFRCYGEIYGYIFGAIMLMQGLAPFLLDIVYEATGSYKPGLIGIAAALTACAGAIAMLPAYRGDVRARTVEAPLDPAAVAA